MKAKRSRRKDGRRLRLIETFHFISFLRKWKLRFGILFTFRRSSQARFTTALRKNGYSFDVTKWPIRKESLNRTAPRCDLPLKPDGKRNRQNLAAHFQIRNFGSLFRSSGLIAVKSHLLGAVICSGTFNRRHLLPDKYPF